MITLGEVLAAHIKPFHSGCPDLYLSPDTRAMEATLQVPVSSHTEHTSPTQPSNPKPPSTPIPLPTLQDDDSLLHPKPRPSILSKRDLKNKDNREKFGGPTWTPGPLIRLLPDAVHIRTIPEKGIDISPDGPPPPTIPLRIPLSLASQMKLVGAIRNKDSSNQFWYEGISTRKWHPGIPLFIRVLLVQPCHFIIAYADGTEINPEPKNQTSIDIEWFTNHTTPDLRTKAAEALYIKVLREIQVIDEVFRETARRYRIARREWEIGVVKREFVVRKNFEVFRVGTTGEMVNRMCRMGRRDIEGEGVG